MVSSSIMVIGDIHGKVSNLNQVRDLYSWLTSMIRLHAPTLVVNLGDVADGHAVLRAEVQGDYRRFVDQCLDLCPYYFHVTGNHEYRGPKDSSYTAFDAMQDYRKGFVLVKTPIKSGSLYFCPYIPESNLFPQRDDFVDIGYSTGYTSEILFAHQTFAGVDFGGFIPDGALDAASLGYERVISGHIHLRQSFGTVLYPGSPFAQNMKDVDQDKGVYLVSPTDDRFLESPLPRYRTATLPQLLALPESDDHFIVRLEGTKADVAAILASTEVAELKKRLSVRIDVKYTDTAKVLDKIQVSSAYGALDNYIDDIYKGTVDKTLLKELAQHYLAKV